MKQVAIIGGGISGLAAAWTLEKRRSAGVALEYKLFESSSRFGGVLATEHVDGCVVEAGPDSFLTEKPWASELCREIGLGDQLIESNDAARKIYVLVKDKLVSLPDGLMFMVPTNLTATLLSPLFSAETKLRVAREWFLPPRSAAVDETVASFITRHYGAEMVERLADPLLAGVYGGEASQLSVRAVLPRFAAMEAEHGSLGRAILAARKKQKVNAAPIPLFTSLRQGMQQLADGVVSRLPASALHANTPVQCVQRQNGGLVVSAGLASGHFDAVIVATPAYAAASLLQMAGPEVAAELSGIPYMSSITVNLGYERNVRGLLPPGFGFLVPRSEAKRLLATTFVHNKFPHRAAEDRALLRCFLGGARNEDIFEAPAEETLRIVREELRQILGLTAEPQFTRIYRWKSAMAQYGVGHLERLERIEVLLQGFPGVALAGNGYRGIGVPDCVKAGQEAAEKVLLGLAEQ
jgi:oxygen-dependent protoporphyrinogen oxidase